MLVRHPGYFAAELVLSTVILVLTGTESPFFYYTLATALLGGLLYGWAGAALFSPMLVAVYYWVISVRSGVEEVTSSFQTDLGQPALYLLVAAAGAGARGLLDRQARAEAQLAAQERQMAAETERSRLARDMHDSLAKTVSGIGFAALGLSRMIERDPQAAIVEARRLADDARQATREAREIITGLRTDDGDAPLPLPIAAQGRGGALGGDQLRSRWSWRSRTWASSTRSRRASSSGSCARRCATRSATRARRPSRCGCGCSAGARC